ncbi:MAG: hypothetical protein ACXVID_10425, partial [Thermoanaerobaculia bacterium]
MISFVTLLLGIIVGARPIEVRAGPAVAAVEFRLDGQLLDVLTAPPWKTSVDFGVPVPHELVAVARDAGGAEIGRAVQRINVPHSLAEATLTLLPGKGGRDRAAVLAWASAVGGKPRGVELTLDGRPLAAADLERIALPTFRPADVHVLRAVLDFGEGASATAELLFGGLRRRASQPGPKAVRDATEAELTAVPAVFKGRPPKGSEMDGWFLADGEPVRVEAVEESPGVIVAVKDETAGPWLAGLHVAPLVAVSWYRFPLGKGQRLRFCWPGTRSPDRSAPGYDVFLRSPEYAGPLDVRSFLISVEPPPCPDPPRLADAVSVAGLAAVAGNRPRAVLLLVAGPDDASSMPTDWARGYLRALRVPLYVWAKDEEIASHWGKVDV